MMGMGIREMWKSGRRRARFCSIDLNVYDSA